jgi:hypothetical protein
MKRATDLRRTAGLYKRLASVPTAGGHCSDRLLLMLADELDREAAELDGQSARPALSRHQGHG